MTGYRPKLMNPRFLRQQTGIDQAVEAALARLLSYLSLCPPDAAMFDELRGLLIEWMIKHNPSDEIPLVICTPAEDRSYFSPLEVHMDWHNGQQFLKHTPGEIYSINCSTCPKPRTVKVYVRELEAPVEIIHR